MKIVLPFRIRGRGDQGKMEKFDNPVMPVWMEHGLMKAFREKDLTLIKWYNHYWECELWTMNL